MNYESMNTDYNSNFVVAGGTKGKKNTMNLWQMIVIAVLLVFITASMFLPVFRINGDVAVNATKDFVSGLGKDVSEAFGIYDIADEDVYKEEYNKGMQEEHVPQYISAFDIMTKPIYSLMGNELEDDMKDDIEEAKEAAEAGDHYAQIALNVVNKYTFLRVCLWIIYMLALALLIPLLLGYFLKWNKYIFSGIGVTYGVGGAILFGYLRFGLIRTIVKQIMHTLSSEINGEDIPFLDVGIDIVKKPAVKALSNFYSLGFLVTFILFILVFGMCVITMLIGSKGTEAVQIPYIDPRPVPDPGSVWNNNPTPIPAPTPAPVPTPAPTPTPAPQPQQPKMGKVKCTAGVAIGNGFMLPADKKVIVGKSKTNANLVIDNPKVSNIHCSIRYNPVKNIYIVKDHSLNGTFVNGVKLQKDVALEYPAGTVLSLADGKDQIKLG